MEGCTETYGRPLSSSSCRSFLWLLPGLAFLAVSLLLPCPSCAGEFTAGPVSVNTTLNSTAIFTCNATGFNTIYFVANGTPTDGVENSEFFHTQDTLLKVWAQAIINNTIISCVGEPGRINSTNAILMIQGQLASVSNLELTFINGSCVSLSWTAPYTLDNVPITGYDIDDDSDRPLNTMDSYFFLSSPNPANPDVCNLTTVSVYALNEVGRGQPNNISFYYQGVPPTAPTTSVIPTINDSRQLSLNISFNASELCRGEYPNIISIDILNADATSICHTSFLVIATGIYPTGCTLPDTVDRFFINITWSNEGGQFDSVLFGPPGPVTNISSFNVSCNTIGISWCSPIGNDAEYYSLSIIDSLDGTLLNNTLVYNNNYQFENDNLFISHYTFDITGVNQFGEGVSNSATFSYLKVPISPVGATFEILKDSCTLEYNIPVILKCTGEAPQNISITVQCNETETVPVVYTHLYGLVNITGETSIPPNQQCNVSVVSSNDAGSSKPFTLILNDTCSSSPSTSVSSNPSNTPTVTPTDSTLLRDIGIAFGVIVGVIIIVAIIVAIVVAIYVIVVRKCNSRRDEDNDVFSNDIELQTPNAQLQENDPNNNRTTVQENQASSVPDPIINDAAPGLVDEEHGPPAATATVKHTKTKTQDPPAATATAKHTKTKSAKSQKFETHDVECPLLADPSSSSTTTAPQETSRDPAVEVDASYDVADQPDKVSKLAESTEVKGKPVYTASTTEEHKTLVKSEEIVKSEEAGTAFRPGRLIDRTVILPTDPPPAAKSDVVQSEEEVLEVPVSTGPPPAAESDVVQSEEEVSEVPVSTGPPPAAKSDVVQSEEEVSEVPVFTGPPPAAKSDVVQSEEEVLEVPVSTGPPAAESDVVQSKEVSEEVKDLSTATSKEED